MPHGADLKTIRREIAFSAILITGMLLEIWITLYREFNYDFSVLYGLRLVGHSDRQLELALAEQAHVDQVLLVLESEGC